MSEAEFTATGVRIERWTRSLTRAGQVLIKDGRLALLTSNGREIDSAPLGAVSAGRPWFARVGRMVATVNGTRYRLTMGQRNMPLDSSKAAARFLDAVRGSRR
ncbi:hypothetical protein OG204_03670 [Streptomyces sp. NBC_01387]|uniref:hypothetical protein n=1 Tax=unclassified Streptomyces TaxID=2593676 RepID=UPI002024F3D0|nr:MULTISPECIES: hypothetical protein [unclassified Streptomyces]MCX4552617.1 hypothetical protein [Streptomyces sp. NBC_01500]WSC23961.1 hypothetical protein OIE60_32180 [Streptomyces sp. NBC_01766]WSV57844.1 hypothetical protein OG282_31450 [Streptomyces sp. NBC_01014]